MTIGDEVADATSSLSFYFTMCVFVGLIALAIHVIHDICFPHSKTFLMPVTLKYLLTCEVTPFE